MTATTSVMADLRQLQQAAAAEYAALVESVATGERVATTTVAGVLRGADRTAEQFQADVQHKAERIRLKAVADGYGEHERQLLATRAEKEELEKELKATTERLTAQIHAHHFRCEELVKLVSEAKQAGRDLLAGYRGPLKEQAAQARQRVEQADRTMSAARKEVKRLEHQLQLVNATPDEFTPGSLERVQAVLDQYRRDLAVAEAERDAAISEGAVITAAMRQP